MKKIIVAILAVLYLGISSGATVHLHYCMGNLTGWSLIDSKGDKCANCGMPKKGKGCCNEQHKLVKIAVDQKVSDVAYQLTQLSAVTNQYYTQLSLMPLGRVTAQTPSTHAPPHACNVALYICNCTFLI